MLTIRPLIDSVLGKSRQPSAVRPSETSEEATLRILRNALRSQPATVRFSSSRLSRRT